MSHAISMSEPVDRYHYLDALRAWSMLLGIVLHAAWLMVPFSIGYPMQDCDAHAGLGWLFTFIHMFRMQVFFLLAGFFANLVYSRSGTWGFLKQRAVRIGAPLLFGWMFLFPWCSIYYTWGGEISGRLRTTAGFWDSVTQQMGSSLKLDLGLLHLWFLYDLVWIYVGTVLVKMLLDFVADRPRVWRNRLAAALEWAIRSPGNTVFLAVPSALLLMPGRYWIGVEGYPDNFVPEWSGLLHYWLFFLVGWLAYARRELLHALHRRWGLQLVVGTSISFAIWGFQWHFSHRQVTFAYPGISSADIHDYPAIRSELLAASVTGSQHPAYPVWNSLPAAWQSFIRESFTVTTDEADGLAAQISEKVILAVPAAFGGTTTNLSATDEPGNAAGADNFVRNRQKLESTFPGAIATRVTDQPRMIMLKGVYCFAYAIGMWSLVFGSMGLFHRWMSAPSPAMRYLAESSYWLYLLHLPVLFQLEMWVGRFPLTPAGKFAFYNLAAVAVLLPSYHYLVRSTFIGKVLNGRKHPFIGFFRSPLFSTPTDGGETALAPIAPSDSIPRPHRPQQGTHSHSPITKMPPSALPSLNCEVALPSKPEA